MRFSVLAGLVATATATSIAKVSVEHVADRQTMIDEINNSPGVTWTAGVNSRFHGLPIGHSKPLMGVQGDWVADINAAKERGEVEDFVPTWSATAAIPDAFDSQTNWPMCSKIIGDVRDQSNCGCCWAFGGAEAASDRMCIATKGAMQFPLSAQDVCFCANPNGCGGGQITTPWTHIKWEGAVQGGQYQGSGPFGKGMCQDFSLPHCHHHGPQGSDPYPAEGQPGCLSQTSPKCAKKCDSAATGDYQKYTFKGAVQQAQGEQAIQQMIMEGGPVETAFSVYSDFENYISGVYTHTTGQMMGGHAVKFVGWGVDAGVKYWKVANSWNPYWGEKGYFRIKFGEGGIDNQAVASDPAAKWSRAGDTASVLV